MTTFEATMIAEGIEDPEDYDQYVEAWQLLIDTGLCWNLQGSFGRIAQDLIDEGICKPKMNEKI